MNTMNDITPTPVESKIDILKKRARVRIDSPIFSDRLLDIQREIRARRKAFLGSSVTLGKIVYADGALDYAAVSDLADYLTTRTVAFWDKPQKEGLWICRQFYELCLSAHSCVELDDVILLANAAAMEKPEIFTDVMTKLVPKSHLVVLSYFVDSCLPLPVSFEEAVLGAISVFLGVLKDPMTKEG